MPFGRVIDGIKHVKIMVVIDSSSFLALGMEGQVKRIGLWDAISRDKFSRSFIVHTNMVVFKLFSH